MPILYVAVFKGSVTAAEFATIDGNFNAVAKEYLAKAGRNAGKYTYETEGTTFNFLAQNGMTFLCVADVSYGRVLPGAFLDKLAEGWAAEVASGKVPQSVAEGQLTSSFGAKTIKSMVDKITSNPGEFDKMSAVKDKVTAAKSIMMTNMQSMIARDDQLRNMEDKSNTLLGAASEFQSAGKKIRTHMWWNNFKMKIIIGAAVLLLALVLFLVICFGVAHCFSGGSNPSPSPSPPPASPPMPGLLSPPGQ